MAGSFQWFKQHLCETEAHKTLKKKKGKEVADYYELSFTDTKWKYMKDYYSTAAVSPENKTTENRMLEAEFEKARFRKKSICFFSNWFLFLEATISCVHNYLITQSLRKYCRTPTGRTKYYFITSSFLQTIMTIVFLKPVTRHFSTKYLLLIGLLKILIN